MRRKSPAIRVLIHGLAYFSRSFPAFLKTEGWDIRTYAARGSAALLPMTAFLHQCDLAYAWAGRITMGKFLSMARLLGKQKLIMFWCGSDVLEARREYDAGRSIEPWIAEKIHWAGTPWLAEEVRAMGLESEYVPTTWVPVFDSLDRLPEKFSVLSYLPDAERVSLYGIDQVLEVARALPSVDFNIVGLRPGQSLSVPDNVKLHGWIADMAPFYRNATVVWRPTRHDGLSFMALQALAYGRYLMWSYPFTGAVTVKETNMARTELQRMLELHHSGQLEINRIGTDFVTRNFSPDTIRDGILSRWRKVVESPAYSAAPEYAGEPAEKSSRQLL